MRLFWRAFVVVVVAAASAAAIVLSWPPIFLLVPLLLLDVVVLAALARLISRQVTAPVADLRRLVEALTRGERGRRARVPTTTELGGLAVALNSLAEKLDHEIAPLRAEQAQTAEILSAMSDGVLLLDAAGCVLRTNRAASLMLGVPVESLEGQPVVHAARTFPAVSLVEQALRTRSAVEAHVEMSGGRRLHVQTIPLRADADNAPGAVPAGDTVLLIVRDETDRLRIEQMRRDFAANVSHELKTPLTGIALLVATLEHAVDDDPREARRFIRRLSSEVAGLNNLMADLLTLSQLEEVPVPGTGEAELVDLREIARSAADGVAARAGAAGVSLEVEATHEVLVSGNRVDLETMTRNLLENAVRFTDPGGHVWVTLDATPGEALLAVRDDGIGIPRDHQTRVFERFYRVDKARSRETGGTGLGLSIVRHVAEGHGGRVELESTLGVGSTFTVRLPVAGETSMESGTGHRPGDGDAVAL